MRSRRRSLISRAALLLEVVVSLTIMVAAMGLLCGQLAGGLNMTAYTESELRASLLADRVLCLLELDPELKLLVNQLEDEDLEDEFGDEYPGYFWRITVEPLERELETIKLVHVAVLHQPDEDRQDSIDGARIVRHLAFLRAEPATVDLVEELGVSEDMLDQIEAMVPISDFDPHAVDLQALLALLDEDLLAAFLPLLEPLLAQLQSGNLPSEITDVMEQLAPGMLDDDYDPAEDNSLTGEAAGLADEIRRRVEEEGGGDTGGAIAPPSRRGGGRGPGRAGGASPSRGGRRGRGGAVQPPRQRGGSGGSGAGGNRGPSGGRGRGGDRGPAIDPGAGSGPDGGYTIEDLMRLREEMQRQQGGF